MSDSMHQAVSYLKQLPRDDILTRYTLSLQCCWLLHQKMLHQSKGCRAFWNRRFLVASASMHDDACEQQALLA